VFPFRFLSLHRTSFSPTTPDFYVISLRKKCHNPFVSRALNSALFFSLPSLLLRRRPCFRRFFQRASPDLSANDDFLPLEQFFGRVLFFWETRFGSSSDRIDVFTPRSDVELFFFPCFAIPDSFLFSRRRSSAFCSL